MACSEIFMIRPSNFGFNPETATTNTFQKKIRLKSKYLKENAGAEFDEMVVNLRRNKIDVTVFNDQADLKLPDAVFPNNWISTHPGGKVIVYPMLHVNRRAEIRNDVLNWLKEKYKDAFTLFDIRDNYRTILEGTGSLVGDHENKIWYAALSPRTNENAVKKVAGICGYDFCAFKTIPIDNTTVYHTNVLMTSTSKCMIICLDLIDPVYKQNVMSKLNVSGKTVVELNIGQVIQFAGNMLEVLNEDKESCLIMSETANQSLSSAQQKILLSHHKIVCSSIPTIEKVGGGSVRCMITEVY